MNNERTLTEIAEQLENYPRSSAQDVNQYRGRMNLLVEALRIAVRRGNFMASTQRDTERILTAVEGN